MDFIPIDNLEDFFEKTRAAETAANAQLTDAQRAITHGSCWARFDHEFLIVGIIQTLPEFIAAELCGVTEFSDTVSWRAEVQRRAARVIEQLDVKTHADVGLKYDLICTALRAEGVEPTADGADPIAQQDSYDRGYRFGKAFSVMCPTGEYGSTHVSHMVPLRRSEFDDVLAAGYDARELLQHGWFAEIAAFVRAGAYDAIRNRSTD